MSFLPRWVAWSIGGVVLACAVALVVFLAVPHGDQGGTPHPDAAVLTAYTQALRAPTSDGGRIVEEEMKPSIGELQQGTIDGATFADRARGWQIALKQVKDRIDRISVPPAIAAAGPLFDQAMDAYIAAARLFEQAGTAPTDQRSAALQRAIAQAQQADRDYDAASLVVQRALAAAQLPADPDLPNPTPSGSP
jgi:hypothetical protein